MTGTITLYLHSIPTQSAEYTSKDHRSKIIAFWFACHGETTTYVIRPKVKPVRGKYGTNYINVVMANR